MPSTSVIVLVEHCTSWHLSIQTLYSIWSRIVSPRKIWCWIQKKDYDCLALVNTELPSFWMLLCWILLQTVIQHAIVWMFSSSTVNELVYGPFSLWADPIECRHAGTPYPWLCQETLRKALYAFALCTCGKKARVWRTRTRHTPLW